MLKVGIVGAGRIAQMHGRSWQGLPAKVQGWHDVVPAAAAGSAQRWGGQVYDSLEALLDACDAVDICTGVHHHKEVALAAAARGIDIVCEKPLARTTADCQEIIDACDAGGSRLLVAQVVRFFPQFEAARNLLLSGELGDPAVIRTVRAGGFPARNANPAGQPYADFQRSGGVVLDVAIHDIDFHRWCCGEVRRVFARGLLEAGIPETDHALILLRFESGAIGHIEASWAHQYGLTREKFEIAGTRGMVEWDSRDRDPLEIGTRESGGMQKRTPYPGEDLPWRRELRHFVECLESGEEFRVSPHDGLMAVKICEAVLASIRSGRPVEIAGFEG